MLFFAGFGHYTVASSEDFELSSKLISKFHLSKSDDIIRVATSAQGGANRVRSVTFTVPPARFMHLHEMSSKQAFFAVGRVALTIWA